MSATHNVAKEKKIPNGLAPRSWSRSPFSKTGPVARFFKMEREARRLASEGSRSKEEGNLERAFFKFQLAASKEKHPSFAADLHEMAADTAFELAGNLFEESQKSPRLLEAAGEYSNAGVKRADSDKEKAAMLRIRAGNAYLQAREPASAKEEFQAALSLTGRQTLRNWIKSQMDNPG